MKRPFADKRPIGPFASLGDNGSDGEIDVPREVKGSTASQSYIYYVLAHRGNMTVAEIYKATGLSMRVIKDQLGNLDNKGYIKVNQTEEGTFYKVVD